MTEYICVFPMQHQQREEASLCIRKPEKALDLASSSRQREVCHINHNGPFSACIAKQVVLAFATPSLQRPMPPTSINLAAPFVSEIPSVCSNQDFFSTVWSAKQKIRGSLVVPSRFVVSKCVNLLLRAAQNDCFRIHPFQSWYAFLIAKPSNVGGFLQTFEAKSAVFGVRAPFLVFVVVVVEYVSS